MSWGTGKPEPVVVVPVVRSVPVAISRPAVPDVVVPAPAANNPVRALRRPPGIRHCIRRIISIPILTPLPYITVHT